VGGGSAEIEDGDEDEGSGGLKDNGRDGES